MGGCCSAWWNKRGFLATSSGAAWFYGVASEHDTLSAWDMENASNIVLVSACTNNCIWRALTCCCGQIGTPQTEHSPSALNVTGCDTVEIFGVLSTAMHPDYYTKQHRGLPALITMSDNRRTRLVAPNVCNSAMIVNSSDAKMRVPEGGTGFKTAIIAWDTSSAGGTGLKSDDGSPRPQRRQARWVQDVFAISEWVMPGVGTTATWLGQLDRRLAEYSRANFTMLLR